MTEKLSTEELLNNYKTVCDNIAAAALKSGRKPQDITLLAATKTVDAQTVNLLIEKGLMYIGENRVQEFLSKHEDFLPVHKHFIGHLQTNKVKDIVGKVELIHSVDSLHLAKEISKLSAKRNVTSDILLEVNIGGEESKSGLSPDAVLQTACEISKLPSIRIRGLMAIPPVCEDESLNRKYFENMYKLFIDIKDKNIDNSIIDTLSMGMSDDYACAVECGATIVRVGTALFGRRIYK